MTVDNALAAFQHLKRTGGQAPGIDGIHYSDLSNREVARYFRKVILPSIRNNNYRPQPIRVVKIPKAGGDFRQLRLQVILDRIVSKMIYEAILAYVDSQFVPWSYGFRPNKSTWQLLASIKIGVEKHGLSVLTHDDVKKAFDHVPIEPLMEVLRNHLGDPNYRNVISAILRKDHPQGKEVPPGIDQGCALSPLLLNLYLHTYSDRLLAQEATTTPSRLFRYADNIGHLTQDAHEGLRLLDVVRYNLERAGLKLKGDDSAKVDQCLGVPIDLRTKSSSLLGFELTVRNGALCFDVQEKDWEELHRELENAHHHAHPTERVVEIIQGLISSIGPALESRFWKIQNQIITHLKKAHFRGEIPERTLNGWMNTSLETWRRVVKTFNDAESVKT